MKSSRRDYSDVNELGVATGVDGHVTFGGELFLLKLTWFRRASPAKVH